MKIRLLKRMANHRIMYLILLPSLLYYFIFCYLPMFGVALAFKEFDYSKGIWDSPWVGFINFEQIFKEPGFWNSVSNTIQIAGMRLLIEFPIPIILALLIAGIRVKWVKNSVQSVLTFPHFLSWIVVSGMMLEIFGGNGVLNGVLLVLGYSPNTILFDGDAFRWFLVFSNLWKEAGWGCIIYLAAIAGINPEMYESASIDGVGVFRKIWNITLPSISSTIVVMFVLFLSGVMNSGGGGFDQIFNLYNPAVLDKSEIIDTFIYRRTFFGGETFESSTAVGLFKSIINFALVLGANQIIRKTGEEGVF